MKHLKILAVLFFTVLSASCATGPRKIPTVHFNEYNISKKMAKQTKENVSIEVKVLKPSDMKKYPELFSFDKDRIPKVFDNAFIFYPEDSRGKSWAYTFGFGERNLLTALMVKLRNNTPHILRMKDARIYLVVEDDGEKKPIKAVTKLGDATPVPANPKGDVYLPASAVIKDESLVHWVTYFENEWEKTRKKGILTFPYPVGFASQAIAQNRKHYKLINDVGVEILPDFSYKGILLFPAIVSFSNAKLMFYDIITKTDAAGKPVEKTSFEFPLELKEMDMWYDRAGKEWRKGLPPEVVQK